MYLLLGSDHKALQFMNVYNSFILFSLLDESYRIMQTSSYCWQFISKYKKSWYII